jgi:ketosteroid isomerase-like protein
MTTNLEAAKELYALFSAGDFDGMAARVTDDTEWYVCTGAPYGGYLHGKQEMLTWMKEKLTLAFTRFEPTRYFVDGDEVVAFVSCAASVPATGKSFALELVHRMRFVDGKLSYMFEFNQDARLIAAAFEP